MASLFCGPSATGNGSGSDFNNLLALPNTTGFVRGNEYVLVDGSYGSKTLSTATSSTTTITIRKANAAQDSGVTGYSSTLHDGQATFGTISVATRYWIVDGITRTESAGWTAPTGYGFKAGQIYANSNDGHDADFSQFRYIDIGDDYSLTYSGGAEAVYIVFNQSDIIFHRCAMHMSIHAIMQAAGASSITVEYCHIGPGWGKEAIRGGNGSGGSNWIIRYNRFWDSTQIDPNDVTSGITAEIDFFGDSSATYSDIAIYGNWFSNSKSGGRNSVVAIGGQGFSDTASNCLVYNNTFAGIDEASVFAMIYLSGTGNIARNNLFYDCVDTDVSANTASDNDVASSDPFTNYATLDLTLSAATAAGFTLSSPYDTDPDGVTRGSDGVWDVGAFEFVGSSRIYISGKASIRNTSSLSQQGKSSVVKRKYVRAGASGSGSGDNWTDAYTSLPASLTRDYTYYVADGSYGSYTFDDAVDGVKTITVKKATVADHGTETGWDNTYGDGQTIFTSLTFQTAYWIIDGTVGGGPGSFKSGHGIKCTSVSSYFGSGVNVDTNEDNILFDRVEIDRGATGIDAGNSAVSLDRVNIWTFRRCWIHNVGFDVFDIAYGCDDFTLEYSCISTIFQGEPGAHTDLIQLQAGDFNRFLVRYCLFEDCVGSYFFGCHNNSVTDYKIYGNIFWFHTTGPNTGNGQFGTISGNTCNVNGVVFCNNTFAGIFTSTMGIRSAATGDFNGIAHNNLIVELDDQTYNFGYATFTQSHNSHYNMTSIAGTGNENPTGNPFTDSTNGDFSLVAETTAGTDMSAYYTVDMFGNPYNDGRGAIAFVGDGSTTNSTSIAGKASILNGSGGGSVVFSRIQSATNDGDPASATFSSTPIEGNLLVVVATERSGTTHANYTISGTGWTKRIGRDSEIANTTFRRNLAVWTKVAGASEPTNIQVDNGTTNSKRIAIHEYSAGTDVTWTFSDKSDNDTGTGSTSPLSTGSTGSVSAGNLLLISIAIWRDEDVTPGSVAWTNATDIVTNAGTNFGRTISVGWFDETAGGTYSDSVSWTGAGHEATNGILVFSAETTSATRVINIPGKSSLVTASLQKAYPTSDITIGNWTTAPLFSKIDEVIPDDNDVIASPHKPTNESCEVKFGPLPAPSNKNSHSIRYRFRKVLNTHSLNLIAGLYDGATLIASQTHVNVQTDWTDGVLTLTSSQANNITNYSDLRLRLTATQ